MPKEVPALIVWTAGPVERIGGIPLPIGLATRRAAFVSSGRMAAAQWMAHGPKALLPVQNHGESAVLCCFAFPFIAARGGGL